MDFLMLLRQYIFNHVSSISLFFCAFHVHRFGWVCLQVSKVHTLTLAPLREAWGSNILDIGP